MVLHLRHARENRIGYVALVIDQRTRGEFALVLHPQSAGGDAKADEGERVLQLLLPELPVKTAVRLAAEISGAPRNALYERALQLRKAGEAEPGEED